MCLLTFMQEGVTANLDDLKVGADNNPDGFGWAVHTGKTVVRGHGMLFDKVLDEFLRQRTVHSGPALFHSRIATHGATSKSNCHPFQIGRDRDSVVAHNGMLPIAEDGGRSDTRVFAEDILPASGGVQILNSKKMRKKLAKFATGSKLVIITANKQARDDYYIINEKDGHWTADGGVWWSNNSYKWARAYTSFATTGMYSSGWKPAGATTPIDDYFWEETWTCNFCNESFQVNETNVELYEACPVCRTCFYCELSAVYDCRCFPNEPTYNCKSDTWESPRHELAVSADQTLPFYDYSWDA